MEQTPIEAVRAIVNEWRQKLRQSGGDLRHSLECLERIETAVKETPEAPKSDVISLGQ